VDDSIVKRTERIEIALKRLETLRITPREQFLQDWKTQDVALHNLQIAIQGCLDIGNHILGLIGGKSPETYVQIVDILAENDVVPQDFIDTAKSIVKFRNLIVHEYMKIDIDKLYAVITRTHDIRKFLTYLIVFLDKK